MRNGLFILLLASGGVAQADSVDVWLQRMQQALATQNFQGTLVIRQHDQLHTMHVVHGHGEPPGQNSWDTLEALNGEPRRVIRRDALVITLFPGKNLATRIHDQPALPLQPQLPLDLAKLKELYTFQLAGEDRVAGWPAQIIEMLPRDQYRYGFRLWLARDNGLLLRSDLLAEQGKVVEQVMYSQLATLKQIPPPGVPDLKNWQVIDLDADQPLADDEDAVWSVSQLPVGFHLVQTRRMVPSEPDSSDSETDSSVQHLLFSDGMTSVSVFVEQPAADKKLLVGVSRMGAINAFGQAFDGHHVTVMGEVPVITVRQIAQSIVHTPEARHD